MSDLMSMSSASASRFVGEMTLLVIAAVCLCYIILKLWPKQANPQLFAALIPFTGLALLAYFGSAAAAAAIVGFAVIAVGLFSIGLV
jgi:hypothetical protein